jgi:hypothetical protein
MSEDLGFRPRSSRRGPKDYLLLAVPVTLAVIAATVVAVVVASRGPGPGPVHKPATARSGCPSSQCAVINTVRLSPVLTQFYGRSCQGLRGAWFLNIVQGGSDKILHPPYRLDWSFTDGSSVAQPTGGTTTAHAGLQDVTVTLTNGVLVISGTGPTGAKVSGQGTLSVQLSGSASAPSLTVTETGMTAVEQKLGLQSPFVVNGGPVVVPVHISATAAGCKAA